MVPSQAQQHFYAPVVVGPMDQGKISQIFIPDHLHTQGDRSLFGIDPKSELVRAEF